MLWRFRSYSDHCNFITNDKKKATQKKTKKVEISGFYVTFSLVERVYF